MGELSRSRSVESLPEGSAFECDGVCDDLVGFMATMLHGNFKNIQGSYIYHNL